MFESMHTMADVFLFVGVLGLVTSTVYAGLVVRAAFKFSRRKALETSGIFTPPVSLLKPLHGNEQDIEAHLETFFHQDYPQFEILFCARTDSDPGLAAARRVAARYTHIPTKFLACGTSPYPNAKVWSLECMQAIAKHEILIVSDSDVSVGRDYLREVVAPFADERVGLVTCLYRGAALTAPGRHSSTIWSELEATGMSIEMSSGVLVADLLEGMQFALGPTMVARRSGLERIGGFAALGPYHADDFVLGNMMAADGQKVVLSTFAVDHHILNASFLSSVAHQIRWMKSTRFSRPKGHLGTVLTYSMPYGILAALAALTMHKPLLAAAFFGFAFLSRAILALAVGGWVVMERNLPRTVFLYALRDFMGFLFWCASYAGRQVEWRGEAFQILSDGKMVITPQEPEPEHGAVVTT